MLGEVLTGSRTRPVLLVASLLALALTAPATALARQVDIKGAHQVPLTPARAVETSRFFPIPDSTTQNNPDGIVSLSPDGSRYLLRVIRGDAARNGVWVEVLAGTITPDGAGPLRRVAQLFTPGLGTGGVEFVGPLINLDPFYAGITWLTNTQIAFPWEDDAGIRQIVRLDVDSSELTFLTRSSTHVAGYGVNRSGDVLYSAMAKLPPPDDRQSLAEGIVISSETDAYSLFRRDLSGPTLMDRRMNTEWFFQPFGVREPRRIKIAGRDVDLNSFHRITVSPDGRTAIVNSAPEALPEAWNTYTDALLKPRIATARKDPREMFARLVQQLWVIDLEHDESRPLWDAPSQSSVTSARFSPDGGRVLVAPVFLPLDSADPAGRTGGAAAVVDIATGDYVQLPVSLSGFDFEAVLHWRSNDVIEVGSSTKAIQCFRLSSGLWTSISCGERNQAGPLFELRQDPNSPPRLFVVDGTHENLLVDPNPGLTEKVRLGRVEEVSGRLDDSTSWSGVVFYPDDYVPGRRYPLVVQSVYGETPGGKFSLYGGGEHLGPATLAPYPGRSLAARGMAVLHLNVSVGARAGSPDEPRVRMHACEAAMQQLIRSGLVDSDKVGIAGFSRNGWYVQYALAHSDFPFAAAIVADNLEPNYVPVLLMGHESTNAPLVGGEPFGTGLAHWLNESPAFSAERIRTPLRIVEQSFSLWGAFLRWELFSRLRHLNHPVELYIMPNAERGAHNPQNPQQVLAVQEGTVDWFDFWLNGHEDPDPTKADQYRRWQQLRAKSEELLSQPRAPALHWMATPQP